VSTWTLGGVRIPQLSVVLSPGKPHHDAGFKGLSMNCLSVNTLQGPYPSGRTSLGRIRANRRPVPLPDANGSVKLPRMWARTFRRGSHSPRKRNCPAIPKAHNNSVEPILGNTQGEQLWTGSVPLASVFELPCSGKHIVYLIRRDSFFFSFFFYFFIYF
jgi:hypothetical protein